MATATKRGSRVQLDVWIDPEADVDWLKESDASVEWITPKRAKGYLAHNVQNRSASKTNIARYATDMENDKWEPGTWEVVKFDRHGNLIDGQNRLHAIIEADKAQTVMVVRNLKPEVRYRLDQGKSRSTSNIMQIAGIENASTKAAITRSIIHVDEWQLRKGLGSFDQAGRFITNAEALRRYQNDPATKAAIDYAQLHHKNFPGMSRAILGGLYYNLHKHGDSAKADAFLTELRLATGKPDSPAMVLRERLLTAANGPKQSRLHRNEVASLVIHAYNRYSQGKSWQRAKLPTVFPRIQKPKR